MPGLAVALSNAEGQEIAWAYFKANVDKYRAMIGKANPSLMSAVIVYSTFGTTYGSYCKQAMPQVPRTRW